MSERSETSARGWVGIIGLGLMTGVAATSVQGCDQAEALCGPCGSIASGQLSISGNARLDGFFTAVADLGNATGTIQADFDANVRALGQLYGLADAAVDADYVAQLKAAIRADFSANIDGSIKLVYKPPACQADINVSVEAQASCEVNADCEAMVNPGEVAVSCEGTCEGSCSAECMGGIKCTTPSAGLSCSGECEGSCDVQGGATCDGTCHGDCMGECSLVDADGSCQGQCDGMCMGSCELRARAECMGTCHGSCYADVDPGGCEGDVQCNGTCMGECSGTCRGKFEPPSASASCDASADCKAQASAQAEANITCTPPSLDWQFSFKAGLDASAQAAFKARLGELRVRGVAIIQGLARAQALFTGKVEGEVVFDPAPVANITAQVKGLISAGFSGDLDIAAGRLPCVLPAFEESVTLLGDIATDFGASIAVQADLVTTITNPMG